MSFSQRRPIHRTEEREQARLVAWSHLPAVRAIMPVLAWLHHSPNGGRRDAFTGAQLKAMGVKRGFPDLILPVQSRGYPGLAIEMKSADGTLQPDQKAWKAHFEVQSWAWRLTRNAQEARAELCWYLGIPPDSAPPLES